MIIWNKDAKKIQIDILRRIYEKNNLIKSLTKIQDKNEKIRFLSELREIFRQLQLDFKFLSSFSNVNHDNDINSAMLSEINYAEEILSILEDTRRNENLGHAIYLNLANLQFKYFEKNRERICDDFKDRLSKGPLFFRYSFNPFIDKIFANIEKAQRYFEGELEIFLKNSEFKQLGITFEIIGDLHIHSLALAQVVPKNQISIDLKIKINSAYECYKQANKYLKKIIIPEMGLMSVRVSSYLSLFYDFFPTNINDVTSKMNNLLVRFPHYFDNKVKSICWKTGNTCEHRTQQIDVIKEGAGIFISMNYNNPSNFEIFYYLRKILKLFNLKAILKQDRVNSPSWTKEICCTIFNNKYSIVLLDKYRPNVVLELGVIIGMGRKLIIVINKNQKNVKESTEDLLFSMIRDYDCIFYRNSEEFYLKLIRGISGIFFNIRDYNIPDIKKVFNITEINKLEKLICK